MENQTVETSSTLKELAEIKRQAREQAKGKKEDELPEGSAPIEAREEEPAEEVPPPAEEAAPAPAPEPEEEITIRGKTFKSQAEAIKYAESLEDDKLAAEAYNQGIRDTLQARTPIEPQVPAEDNFEEQFYSNPKETLQKVKEQAKAEVIAVIQAEKREEEMWRKFADTYPDLADSKTEVYRILQENAAVLNKMTDVDRAMQILATKTRSYFQTIAERFTPRTALPQKSGQVVSSGGGAQKSVTPVKKDEAPLDFVTEMKKLRGYR